MGVTAYSEGMRGKCGGNRIFEGNEGLVWPGGNRIF